MALDYGGLENMRNKENWLEQRELGQKDNIYYTITIVRMLGQNKKQRGAT